MIHAGHRYPDVLGYTITQARALIDAGESHHAQRLAQGLVVIRTAYHGEEKEVQHLHQELSCSRSP